MEWAAAAVLRRCRRCCDYRPILAFKTGALVCDQCVYAQRRVGRPAVVRGYALTDKARAWLATERTAA